MLLAIDARNRSVALGFRSGGVWRLIRRLGASPERSADEYAYFMAAAWAEANKAAPPGRAEGGGARDGGEDWVEAALISSVVPALTPRLAQAVARVFGLEAQVLGPGMRTGVKIRTDLPSELGSDLVASAAAARELVAGPCVIADFGAVLAFSALSAAGEFLGASIVPGLEAAAEALRHTAALLPEVGLEAPLRAIGKTSAESVRSGLLLGYGGLVERLVGLMREELADAAHPAASIELVGTGEALARSLVAPLKPSRFVPDLALEGLALIAGRR